MIPLYDAYDTGGLGKYHDILEYYKSSHFCE